MEIVKIQDEKMKHKLKLKERYEEKILRKFKVRNTFRTSLLPDIYYHKSPDNQSDNSSANKNIIEKYKDECTILNSDGVYNMKTIDKFIGNKSVLDTDIVKIIDIITEFEKKEKNLKEICENLKSTEMNRLFKEFVLNDYEKRFYTNKNIVIASLIGEEQMHHELLRQAKEEKVK